MANNVEITAAEAADWIDRAERAMSQTHGSNDDEHDLLIEISETIARRSGVTFTVGQKFDGPE
jgi:hypothetical protein